MIGDGTNGFDRMEVRFMGRNGVNNVPPASLLECTVVTFAG